MNRISGREVAECGYRSTKARKPRKAPSKFGKADLRYWKDALFQQTYKQGEHLVECRDYSVRIMHKGRRAIFSLGTQNENTASGKAKEIYEFLKAMGWDATLAKYKEKGTGTYKKSATTVGEFFETVMVNSKARPKTFGGYCKAFRTIVAAICKIDGGHEKYDYVNGGHKRWIQKVDAVKLARITPEKVKLWRDDFIKRARGNPLKEKTAKISVNTTMRQAKSLFTEAMLENVQIELPDGLPFDGVKFEAHQDMKYKSRFDVGKIIRLAMEGDENNPPLSREQQKIFLLAVMAGLRRNEIDKIEWSAFLWEQSAIRIEETEYLKLKTKDSAGDVDLEQAIMDIFKGFHKEAKGTFVVESKVPPRMDTQYNHYRCQRDLKKVTKWLRAQGIEGNKPLHAQRKEFGSQLNKTFGIYAASRALRHSDIAVTAGHYLDVRKRATVGLSEYLPNATDEGEGENPAVEPTPSKAKRQAANAKAPEAEESNLVDAPEVSRKPNFFQKRAAASTRKRGR